MAEGNHYSQEGFKNVLSLQYYHNKGISAELKGLYPNLLPIDRPVVPKREISPEWLVGFVDGEGCFSVITKEEKTSSLTTPVSRKVWLYFQITPHGRDVSLLERIVAFLGCGGVTKRNTATFDTWDYKLIAFTSMESIIIPFFINYPLQSTKLFDFRCFVSAAYIIKNKSKRSWTMEEFYKIKRIKEKMGKYD